MNRFCSIFSQLLQLFPRLEFQNWSERPKPSATPGVSAAGPSSFPCCSATWAKPKACGKSAVGWPVAKANWPPRHPDSQALDSVLCQRAPSLGALRAGVPLPARSVPDADRGRRRKPFRFKNPLVSLDATVIDLCARYSTGPVPAHQRGRQSPPPSGSRRLLAEFACITEGAVSDLTAGRSCTSKRGPLSSSTGLYRLRWYATSPSRGLLRHPAEKQRQLRGGQAASAARELSRRLRSDHPSLRPPAPRTALSLPPRRNRRSRPGRLRF